MIFLLTVIDVFSKVAWCVPMKNKSAMSLVAALTTTFSKGWPKTLQTGQGLEFLNKSVQALLKKYGNHHFSTHNAETKTSIVERFNRTLKTRMWRYFTKHQTWRYIDVLQDLVQSYNNTPPHRRIGMTPSQVSAKNQEEVWQRLYGHDGKGVPKLRVSDRVRVSKYKGKFEKGYAPNWSEEMFTIHEVHPSDPPVYRLRDDLGEVLDGTFYELELQKVLRYYKGPVTLMNRVNKGLDSMSTDKTRAKLGYNVITQKMTLHMSSDTVFTIPYHSALGPMLGFRKSVVTSPTAVAAAIAADSTRHYVHPRLGGTDIGVTPSATVIIPPTHSPDVPYPFCKEAEDVVSMTRGFNTIYVYTDIVESRIVGDSLAPLLRALPVSGSHGATVSDRFTTRTSSRSRWI